MDGRERARPQKSAISHAASTAPSHNTHNKQHQANLALLDGTNRSLVMRWVDAVAAAHVRALEWPLRSLSADALFEAYRAREARDRCRLEYTLEVAAGNSTAGGAGGGRVLALTVASRAPAAPVADGAPVACAAPLLVGADAAAAAAAANVAGGMTVEAAGDAAPAALLRFPVAEGYAARFELPSGLLSWAALP